MNIFSGLFRIVHNYLTVVFSLTIYSDSMKNFCAPEHGFHFVRS